MRNAFALRRVNSISNESNVTPNGLNAEKIQQTLHSLKIFARILF